MKLKIYVSVTNRLNAYYIYIVITDIKYLKIIVILNTTHELISNLRNNHFNGLDWSLLVIHLVIEDIHNSWLYCFTNPLELGTRVSCPKYVSTYTADDAEAKHVSQVQED